MMRAIPQVGRIRRPDFHTLAIHEMLSHDGLDDDGALQYSDCGTVGTRVELCAFVERHDGLVELYTWNRQAPGSLGLNLEEMLDDLAVHLSTGWLVSTFVQPSNRLPAFERQSKRRS